MKAQDYAEKNTWQFAFAFGVYFFVKTRFGLVENLVVKILVKHKILMGIKLTPTVKLCGPFREIAQHLFSSYFPKTSQLETVSIF